MTTPLVGSLFLLKKHLQTISKFFISFFFFLPLQVQVGNSVRPVINISDERPKLEEVRYRMRTGSGQRFPITEEEVCYYNAICGLAHSQWSG